MSGKGSANETTARANEIQNSDLRIFVATVEEKSFSAAARALGLSQPTVSLRLQHLEEQLGLRLVERRGGVTLTDQGREIYNRARQILRQVAAFNDTAREIRELERGRLRIGFSSPRIAMTLISAFRSVSPNVELVLSHASTWDLTDDLKSCEIDVAVTSLDTPLPDFLSCKLAAPHRLAAIVPAEHPAASAGALDWPMLAKSPLVVRQQPSMTRTTIDDTLRGLRLSLEAPLEVPTRESLKEAVIAGLGIGVLFDVEIDPDARITPLEIRGADSSSGVYVAALQDTRGLPAIEAFFALIPSPEEG